MLSLLRPYPMLDTGDQYRSLWTVVRCQFLILLAMLCPWHGAAAMERAGVDALSAPAFVPVRLIEMNPLDEFSSRVRPDQEAADIVVLLRNKEFDKAIALAERMTQARPNDPKGYNWQGMAFLAKQDRVNARRSFQNALRVSPGDPTALVSLAQIDIQQKDTASAQKRLQAVLEKDPKNVTAMLSLAQLEILKGDSEAVLAWFHKAKSARPDAVDPRLNIGAYHMRRGNLKEAVAELLDAARVIPGNPDILSMLGEAQLADGQGKAATETFMKLVATRPSAALAYYQLANAQLAANNTSGAAKSLAKALQIRPDYVDAAILLAGVEAQAQRYPEALKLAKLVQSAQPGSPAGLALEGDVLMAQKRYADAANVYEKALEKGAANTIVAKLYAAHLGSGRAKEADGLLQRWLKDHPDDVFVLQFAAGESLRKGEIEHAIEHYRQVLQKDPKNQTALNNLAALYQQVGDGRALQTAELAYKLNPQSPAIADTLGWILLERGDVRRGIEMLQSALARDPNNPQIRYHLAVGWAKSGDKAKAKRELEGLLAREQRFPQRDSARALLKQL